MFTLNHGESIHVRPHRSNFSSVKANEKSVNVSLSTPYPDLESDTPIAVNRGIDL